MSVELWDGEAAVLADTSAWMAARRIPQARELLFAAAERGEVYPKAHHRDPEAVCVEMPKRPDEHVIADRALASVQKTITDAGFAAEVVHNDYGEDLLVQTSSGGEMDASRIWFQVKGTRRIANYRRATGCYAYSVPIGHAMRWLRSADPVTVVLWDVSNEVGYFAVVGDGENWWGWTAPEDRRVRIQLKESDRFDEAAVHELAWVSRVSRYESLLMRAKAVADDLNFDDDDDAEAEIGVNLMALDFLATLGMVKRGRGETWQVVPAMKEMFIKHFEGTRKDEPQTVTRRFATASILTLLEWTHLRTKRGLTWAVIEPVSEMIASLFLVEISKEIAPDDLV